MAKKILIADDDPIIIKLLQVNLELDGYEVVTAEDGAEAVERATETKPDLIILDIMMPRMDGWTALQELKRQPETAKAPVILLSAKAQQEDIRKGYEAGAAEYFTKPFDPSDLLSAIEQILAGTYKRPDNPRR